MKKSVTTNPLRRVWLITSIRLGPGEGVRASTIQNLQTALALADQGVKVAVWVTGRQRDYVGRNVGAWVRDKLGREIPPGVQWRLYRKKGGAWAKKSPFGGPWDLAWTFLTSKCAREIPDLIISRSPSILAQLRGSRWLPRRTRLVLEYQYPEYHQLWRGWRAKHAEASRRKKVGRLRRLWESERANLPAADGVLYAARGHEGLLARLGYGGPMQWLPSSAPKPQPGVATNIEYEFGYSGSLTPENGIEELLEALARLNEGRLLIIGGGAAAFEDRLHALARRLEVGGRVTFAGRVEPKSVRARLRRCRVGIVPVSARQGPEKRMFASPLKLMEWWAAGVPVVAARVPSLMQHLGPGAHGEGAGLLVAPDDAAALAEGMREIMRDAGRLQLMSERAVETAARLTYTHRAERIVEFYRSLGTPPVHPAGENESSEAPA